MTVNLTPQGQELVEAALARGAANGLSAEERERRRQAVAAMLAFREEYRLTLGPGERIQDLVHEGHKY
jgi:hypothetical protein